MANIRSLIKEWLLPFAIAVVLTLLIQTFIVQPVKVPSESMIPSIQINDRLAVNKMKVFTRYEHGDIVVFDHAAEGAETVRYVKRLIGLPGDTVEVRNGVLYVNGVQTEEPYLLEKMNYSFGPVQVPDNKYLFLGDNRNNSYDAHLWPQMFVDENNLKGKVFFRFYPFDRIGPI
jgi:signal peptidase I